MTHVGGARRKVAFNHRAPDKPEAVACRAAQRVELMHEIDRESACMVDAAHMQIQLRDYRIRHGRMDAWIAGWKSQIVPLREEAGFRVIGAWVDAQDDRLCLAAWLLRP